ncbi:hypothetical protein BDW02DRAFT_596806 [Decorospora gaudefroyi]|uniref:RRM domain-containing protein n=1 Tax=Decorospora gaudefroyi TaxID=184978 RepID=A0A6A5KD92_9PLEO|nr:hypothetical protein BDW02DRAFT_596806 [Decorospora gaudefroyi]
MSEPTATPLSATSPTTDEPATMSVDKKLPPSTTAGAMAAPVQSATRHPDFGPGVGKAFLSTELGSRPPRSLGPIVPPVIARSINDPPAVVSAARYWQGEYKDQCLCIFPGQGWVVEDLWDAEDLHIEGRAFCEEMLTFISRSTYYAAKQFADDWSLAHPDRLDFTGLQMGNVYDLNDPLAIVDQIFTFGEPISFPRPFLWHVAYMLIATMMEKKFADKGESGANDVQQPSVVEKQGDDKAAEALPTDTTTLAEKKQPSSAVTTAGRMSTMPPAAPNQPGMRPLAQRAPTQGPPQSAGYHLPPRGAGPPTAVAPNMYQQAMNVPKGNRNVASGSYNQQLAWSENVSRGGSGSYLRQPSGTMSSTQSPQYAPATMAMGQPMAVPVMPGSAMAPYGQGHPMMQVPGYPIQHFDTAMVMRGPMHYQPGPMHAPPMGPAYPFQHQGPHGATMGDMTNNMHYPNNMAAQYPDPRAPMPHRTSNLLFDPYNGANPKFNNTTTHKKGAYSNFPAQSNRGRKASTSIGRVAYSSSNTDHATNVSANAGRYTDFSARRRFSEDDPKITSDPVTGCAHTWIGAGNSTVTELWVGDLPSDAHEDEVKQMFQQNVGITPTAISIKHNTSRPNNSHAFATFASNADAKAALTIREHDARLRNGAFRPSVTVPKRYYQKDLSPTQRRESSNTGYFVQSHAGQAEDRDTRSVARMTSYNEERPVAGTDVVPVTAGGKALYSPQDARSGVLKKSTQQSEAVESTRTGSPKREKSKRQQKSPTKNVKTKSKLDAQADAASRVEDVTEVAKKLKVDGSTAAAADVANVVEDSQATKSTADGTDIGKQVFFDAATIAEEPITSLEDNTTMIVEVPNSAVDSLLQPLKHPDASGAVHEEAKPQTMSSLECSTVETTGHTIHMPLGAVIEDASNAGILPDAVPNNPPLQPADDTISEDEAKNDISFHSAQEIQTHPTQVELQPDAQERLMTSDPHISILSDTNDEPDAEKSVVPPVQPEPQVPATMPQDDTEDKMTSTQDLAPALRTENEVMSTPMEASRPETTKKGGPQQVQSLFPFVKTTSKTQAKREKEAKKKQAKKEEAAANAIAKEKAQKEKAAIAKAKAEKDASSVKRDGGPSTHANKEQATVSGDSSALTDAPGKPAAANQTSTRQATPGSKKSKGKAKAKVATVEDEKKVEGGDESGKPNGGNTTKVSEGIASVTQKADIAEISQVKLRNQGSSNGSGASAGPRDTSLSPSPHISAATQDAQATSEKRSTHEVNHLKPSTLKPSTHTQGSQGSGFEIDSHQSPALPSAYADTTPVLQHTMFIPESHPGRHSAVSSATLRDDDSRAVDSIAPPPNNITSGPSHVASAGADVTPAHPHQFEVSKKKKKNKNKKKKKSAATADAADPVNDAQAAVPDTTPQRVPLSRVSMSSSIPVKASLYDYDPFSSQIDEIDGIRRAKQSDIATYFQARWKMIEDEGKEREKAGLPPKIDLDELNGALEAYWNEFPAQKPENARLFTKAGFGME